MNIQIELGTKTGRLLERKPFLVAENEGLTLEVISGKKEVLLVTLKNGEETARLTCIERVDVPKRLLKHGLLESAVALYEDGILVRHWYVEPIRIIEHEESFTGHAEFEEIQNRIAKIEAVLAALSELSEKTAERVTELDTVLAGIDDIVNDPLAE